MKSAIYALFPDADAAQGAVDALGEAGLRLRDITVISSQPFEEYRFGQQDAKTFMPWIAVLGGVIGGLSGFLLAALSQKQYPILTGGMPIVPLWPNGIITYELTMLGAILASLLTLLVTAGLPDWRPKLYDPAVADGQILVGVVDPAADVRPRAEAKLRAAGAKLVKEYARR
jgi:hypothetical protein